MLPRAARASFACSGVICTPAPSDLLPQHADSRRVITTDSRHADMQAARASLSQRARSDTGHDDQIAAACDAKYTPLTIVKGGRCLRKRALIQPGESACFRRRRHREQGDLNTAPKELARTARRRVAGSVRQKVMDPHPDVLVSWT